MLHEEFVRKYISLPTRLWIGTNGFIYTQSGGGAVALASNTEWNNMSDVEALFHTAQKLGISTDSILGKNWKFNMAPAEPGRKRKVSNDPEVAGKKSADLFVAVFRTDAPPMTIFKIGMMFADIEQFSGQDSVAYAEQWVNTFAQYNHVNAPMAIESPREN